MGCLLNQVRVRMCYLYDYVMYKGWLRMVPTPA